MRADKKIGYFGIGMDLTDATVLLGANPVKIDSEKATKFAIDMVRSSYRVSLDDIATEKDLEAALAYMAERESYLLIRGLAFVLIVEEKMFLPSTGLQTNDILSRYLSRPARITYARKLSNYLRLPFHQSTALEVAADRRTTAELIFLKEDPRARDKELLQDLDRMGFRGRRSIMESYLNGNIGKKIIESHSR